MKTHFSKEILKAWKNFINNNNKKTNLFFFFPVFPLYNLLMKGNECHGLTHIQEQSYSMVL